MQKREKDQVIITCSGFVEMMEGMIRLVLVCSSCTAHVGGDVSANTLVMVMVVMKDDGCGGRGCDGCDDGGDDGCDDGEDDRGDDGCDDGEDDGGHDGCDDGEDDGGDVKKERRDAGMQLL